jgi:hypothetical protein
MMVSAPAAPVIELAPLPPVSESAPAPPMMVSSPRPAETVVAVAAAVIVSSPLPVVMLIVPAEVTPPKLIVETSVLLVESIFQPVAPNALPQGFVCLTNSFL